uniref:Uncharacterized protein n=1 Tax=Panagrolaimus sp. JU765 TaxID=591449 RepID=A0AC34RN76_9BILA
MAVKVMLMMIEKILESNVYSNTNLADSVLTAASFISKSYIEDFKEKTDVDLLEIVKNGMRNSPSTAHKLRLYIQAFAMWNIEEFCYIVKQGIHEVAIKLKLEHLLSKRDLLLLKGNASRGKSWDNLKKSIIYLLTALNYGPSGGILIKDYGYLLVECNKFLNSFLEEIPKLTDGTEEEDFWLNVYDLHTVLSIICASEASANAKGYMENDKEEVITFDTFNHEV